MVLPTMMVKVRPKHIKDLGDNNFKDVSSTQVNELGMEAALWKADNPVLLNCSVVYLLPSLLDISCL